ncbi:MAG: DPP IV N-terminal domain-containing protein [Acidobacteriota bacterium]
MIHPNRLVLRGVFLAAFLPAAFLQVCTAAASESRGLTMEEVVPLDGASQAPSRFAWSPDGRSLAYLRDDGEGQALWVVFPADGLTRRLIQASRFAPSEASQEETEPARAEALRDTEVSGRSGNRKTAAAPSIELFRWSPTSDRLLLQVKGDLYLVPLAGGDPQRLTHVSSPLHDPRFAPDGESVAFVQDHDLKVLDLSTGRIHALTGDGRENETLNGETDWVYGEEIWSRRPRGYWWSPDGVRIAFYHFEEGGVETYPLLNLIADSPVVRQQRYPRPGGINPVVRIGIRRVEVGPTIWLKIGGQEEAYVARVRWAPDGRKLAIQRLNRAQNRLDLLLCQVADGRCSTILTETTRTWINLGDDFRFLKDGRFIWGSARSGWRRLYLHAASGEEIRLLTPEGWAVTSLDGLDADSNRLVFTGFQVGGLGAAERHVLQVPLDPRMRLDSGLRLTSRPGWHTALVAPGTAFLMLSASDDGTPPVRTIQDRSGKTLMTLPAGLPLKVEGALPRWEFMTIPGPHGIRLPARLMRPENFDPQERYPVIMYHYGCPGSQVVANRWPRRGRGLWHKMMAQQGYVIFSVDNEASLFFGGEGEAKVRHRFGPLNLSAQQAGLAYLGTLPYVDLHRVGLWGWSGGGSNTLYCILNSPGTWKAAVSGAPVTDWRLYDSIWTERYLGLPAEHAEEYRLSSPLIYAGKLSDPILLVHGTADDNVHPKNSVMMARAWVEAGRPFQEATYPRQKHGFRPRSSRHFYERMTAFFRRELAVSGRPMATTGGR